MGLKCLRREGQNYGPVDRGGLWHISDQTYGVFVIMEEIIRRHLSLAGVATPMENARQVLVDVIRKNEDLLFEWDMLSAEVEEEVSVAVLHKIIDLYVTVRGFGFATSCLEIYKQAHQTTLQKKRKHLEENFVNIIDLVMVDFTT